MELSRRSTNFNQPNNGKERLHNLYNSRKIACFSTVTNPVKHEGHPHRRQDGENDRCQRHNFRERMPLAEEADVGVVILDNRIRMPLTARPRYPAKDRLPPIADP
jgi:hypothetical protein